MIFLTEQLHKQHQKAKFSCSKPMLDEYLHKQASQDVKRKLSACFVLSDKETFFIKGYYTLSNSGISSQWIPDDFRKRLPRSYHSIPATLLGRLAVDKRYQSQKIGRLLLMDALKRYYEASKSIGSFAVLVDPMDDEAHMFYQKYGFLPFSENNKMFLPTQTIKHLFENK